MRLSNPQTPTDYVTAISDALDLNDDLILNFLVKKFSIIYPNEYQIFAAAMQAELNRTEQ